MIRYKSTEQGYERRSEKIIILVTPSFRKKLDNFLGDLSMSTFFMRLAERAMNDEMIAEHTRVMAAAANYGRRRNLGK
jgi:hypothetical protein